jgi:hypothetical protein
MATKVETGQSSMTVAAYGNETVQDEQLAPRRFPPGVEPAFVRVSIGKTISLGGYEFLRIDVSVTEPCLPSEKAAAYEEAAGFAADRLIAEEHAWLGQAKPKAAKRRG